MSSKNRARFAADTYPFPPKSNGGGGGGSNTVIVQDNGVSRGSFTTINTQGTGFDASASGPVANLFLTLPLAIGPGATATGTTALAIGDTATASDFHSVAIGANTTADNTSAVAIGSNSHATGFASAALCGGITSVNATSSFAFAGGFATKPNCIVTCNNAGTTTTGEMAHGPTALTGAQPGGSASCQFGTLSMVGQTPGIGVGESVTLLAGSSDPWSPANSADYLIILECSVSGLIGGVQVGQAFIQKYVIQSTGVPVVTIAGAGTPEQFGSAGASTWTLAISISGDVVVFTFTTGATTAKCNINCGVRYREMGAPAP